MFKTLNIFDFSCPPPFSSGLVEEHLAARSFVPCGPSQAASCGWVPPRGDNHGALVEVIAGHWILKLMIETKKVPAEVLKRKLDERRAAIEEQTGRKPGKKESRELQEEILLDLLPAAFPSRSAVTVWLDIQAGTLALDATGAKGQVAIAELVRAIPDFSIRPITTVCSPAGSMSAWLLDGDLPNHFTADRSCELQACDESKARVKYDRHSLDIEEVRNHIATGKLPTKLAMTYADRVSFVLTDKLVLKGVDILDAALEDKPDDKDAFDADVVIATGELSALITNLVDALGGRQQIEPSTNPRSYL